MKSASGIQAAERYARALFEIARLVHKDEEIEAELEAFSAALTASPALEKFFLNPQVKTAEKRELLLKIYQERNHEIYEQLLNFFTILFEKNRFDLVHDITVIFKRIADEAQGQGTAEITSAVPLDARAEAAIVERLEKMAGYKIEIKKAVDASLIGGVIVRIKNKVVDGSIHHKIGEMKKELTKIGSL